MLKRSARIFRGSSRRLVEPEPSQAHARCSFSRNTFACYATYPALCRKRPSSSHSQVLSLKLNRGIGIGGSVSTQGRNYWGSSLVYWLSAKFNTMDTSLGATKRPHASTPESTAAYEEQGNEKKRPCTEGGGEKKEETKVLRAEDFDEETLKKELNLAGKVGDLEKALELFDVSKKKGYQLNQKSCQVILHLLSGGEQWMELVESSANFCELSENPYKKSLCNRDKELYDYMKSAGHELNEFFYTGLARVAAICGDSEGALNIAQSAAKIKGKNKARLRTFAPALFAFCYSNNVKRAMEVENEIRRLEVQLTENEYRGIIDAIVRSKDTKYGSYVLECMLREITWIHHSTANSLARYFETYHERALEAGGETGETPLKYKVSRDCIVDTTGLCCGCDKKLQLLDLKQGEMKTLAEKIGLLAGKRESRNDAFGNFRRWVDRHGPFDIIIDAANVGFFGQAKGGVFTFMQVMELHREVKMKWPNSKPLIILHAKRYQHFVRTSRRNEEIMQELKKNHEIFATPPGSNDDWYWIYAAVHGGVNGLLVTNDELRDHIFQTLESKNFNRWKLAHQVRFTIYEHVAFKEPMEYSPCIQRTQQNWHFPVIKTNVVDGREMKGKAKEVEITSYLCCKVV